MRRWNVASVAQCGPRPGRICRPIVADAGPRSKDSSHRSHQLSCRLRLPNAPPASRAPHSDWVHSLFSIPIHRCRPEAVLREDETRGPARNAAPRVASGLHVAKLWGPAEEGPATDCIARRLPPSPLSNFLPPAGRETCPQKGPTSATCEPVVAHPGQKFPLEMSTGRRRPDEATSHRIGHMASSF